MTDPSLFGILIIEREPLAFVHFLGLLQSWLQIAGGCAAVGLAAYLFYAMIGTSDSESNKIRMPINYWMLITFSLSVILYAVYFFLMIRGIGTDLDTLKRLNQDPNAFHKQEPPSFAFGPRPENMPFPWQPVVSAAAGLIAILGIGQPFVMDLFKLRMRRILALSRLGFKEAIRSRVFWIFLVFLIPFLFPVTWFIQGKPEDEIRTTVRVTSIVMQLLLLASSILLASFSIPNDIKNQNIYTIVSKPVERFEIILGRFFGYTALMTIAMLVMTAASVLLIRATNFDEKAYEESFVARMPHRGNLMFQSRKGYGEGINVGREFDYRKYIGGAPNTTERAIWFFRTIPSTLTSGDKDAIRCEFNFDIFRLTKGEENRGVDVNIRITTWQCEQVPPQTSGDGEWRWVDQNLYAEYVKTACEKLGMDKAEGTGRQYQEQQWDTLAPAVQARLAAIRPGSERWAIVNELAEKFGFYEFTGKEVYDYHPDGIPVPVGLFKNARSGEPKPFENGTPRPLVFVAVKCTSPGQMLGMAEGDLHLLEGVQPFELNYFKFAFGLWCVVALIIAVCVTLSAYLAGVVTLLASLFLLLSAYLMEHLKTVAFGTSTGGGPFESLTRLLRTDMPTTPLDDTAGVKTALGLDTAYSWAFRQFFNILPEIDAFNWTNYLKEGFNINGEYMIMNFLVLIGYILPWAVLSYYLLRNREVAA